MKKVNPRRRPATQADVDKAKKAATAQAIRGVAAICMYILREKFGFGRIRLLRFWSELESLAQEVGRGELTVREIEDVLRDEYGINIAEG